MEKREIGGELVFGLDIGTRNVVGTVGYKIGKEFVVVAQHLLEHETRAMMDGQIHDIGRVGKDRTDTDICMYCGSRTCVKNSDGKY